MRRVSSRQRLVSWDAFDATRKNDITAPSEDGYSDCDTCTAPMTKTSNLDSEESTKRRKRGRSRKKNKGSKNSSIARLQAPTVIPSFAWEIEPFLHLNDLPQDIHLNVASFLDLDSIRHFMTVNHKYREMMFSSDAHTLWLEHCQQLWKLPAQDLVDSYAIPTAAGVFRKHSANLPLLLSMTPERLPTRVDETLIDPGTKRATNTTSSASASASASRRSWRSRTTLELYKDETDNDKFLVRYTGEIGAGDRCIRANHALPRPERKLKWKSFVEAAHPTLFDLLYRGAVRAISKRRDMSEWRPFVSPHIDRNGALQVTPRMVAYYEVSIISKPPMDEDENAPTPLPSRSSNSECVAIGVATESFHVHSRMPGWDSQSFGYHGDDGGIFHSSGGMVDRFGPCFGAGDTVGCGIDYVAQGIFFTLNGKYLGYGWKDIDSEFLQNNLYPVVGIDTNAPISVNFGAKPFQFDLSRFTDEHEKLISSSYQLTFDAPVRSRRSKRNHRK